MTVTAYPILAREAVAEIEVQGSLFRCLLTRVEDEADARAVIDAARREHWKARHHCSAMIIGPDRSTQRSSDDGEPPGTAGAPILGVLAGSGISDVVAVVSRWFGGVLLGTGGLTRAYSDAVRAALDDAPLIQRVLQEICEVSVELSDVGKLEHELRSRGTKVLGVEYTDLATIRLAVAPSVVPIAEEIVADLTEGSAQLSPTRFTLGRQRLTVRRESHGWCRPESSTPLCPRSATR